jgi:hypothetical protein
MTGPKPFGVADENRASGAVPCHTRGTALADLRRLSPARGAAAGALVAAMSMSRPAIRNQIACASVLHMHRGYRWVGPSCSSGAPGASGEVAR